MRILLILSAMSLCVPVVKGQTEAKLVASDGTSASFLGYSVAVSGNAALAGSWGRDAGSAYVYRYDGSNWIETKLSSSDGESGDRFGWAVAIEGNVALVSAPNDDDGGMNSGSVYVFRYVGSQWTQEQKLVAYDAAGADWFGSSVALSGDVAVVGAWRDDGPGLLSGSAYVFHYEGGTWTPKGKLLPVDGGADDNFGVSVAVHGDVAVVGAFQHDLGEASDRNYGAAYVYRYNGTTWGYDGKLVAADPGIGDLFGQAVAVTTDLVVVGAPFDDDLGDGSGAVYTYRYSGGTWVDDGKLLPSDGELSDIFGHSLAVSHDVLAVGAWGDRGNAGQGLNTGAAYVFARGDGDWAETRRLTASDGAEQDQFGWAVALDGNRVVIGAPQDDDAGGYSGSAYVFDGSWTPTAVESDIQDVGFRLEAPYPNPFRETAAIRYALKDPAPVSLTVFDMLGRQVRTLDEGWRPAGIHEAFFVGADLPAGMYFCRMNTGAESKIRPLLRIR